MKTFLLQNPKRILAIAGLASICGLFGTASAQTHLARVYATTQGWSNGGLSLGSGPKVNNPTYATTTDLKDYSSLTTGTAVLGVDPSVTQYLAFDKDVPANTPIHIKISLPQASLINLLGLLGSATAGTFTSTITNPNTGESTVSGKSQKIDIASNLVDLIGGVGTNEIIIIPSTTVRGVYFQLGGLLQTLSVVTNNASLFHAYYMGSTPGDAGCPEPIDILSGITADGGLANIGGGITGAVNDPWNAIDDDASLSTYARLFVGAGIANKTYLDALFNVPAKANDSVTMVIQDSANGVLSLASASVLTSIKIQPYMDNTPVGAAIPLDNSGLIKLSLFPGASSKGTITFPVTAGDFNRVEISFQGIAGVSRGLNVFNIAVKVPAPNASAGVTNSTQYAYAGNNVVLKANANANGDAINWYTNADGTGGVASTITNPAVGTYTYYALSSRDGCVDASGVDTLNLHVVAASNPELPDGNVNEPYSQVVTIDGPTTGLPKTPSYKFTFVSSTNPSGTTVNGTVSNVSSFGSIGGQIALANIPVVYGAGPLNISQFATTPIELGDGLQYNVDDNKIEGTPSKEGNFTVTFSVYDENNDLDVGNITKTITIGQALPVTLTNFDVNLDANKNAVVTWTTESEQGSIRFDVLRSNDGTNFSTIGSVDAAGISTKSIDYSFTDHNPGAKSYYKLNVVKNDGIKSSNIVSITGGRVAGFSINPNPASNDITITGLSDIKTVSIYDASGRLVQTATNSHISVRNLSQGIYFVTVVTKDGNKVNSKFIKK